MLFKITQCVMKGIAAPSTMFPLSIWFLCCKVEILFFPRTLFGCMFCPIFFLEATRQSVLPHPDPGPLHMFSEFEYMNLSFVLQYHCLGSFSHFFGFHHSLQCPADHRCSKYSPLRARVKKKMFKSFRKRTQPITQIFDSQNWNDQ